MNMKKIIAGVAASALAVSAMAMGAFADAEAITFVDETGKGTLGDSSKGDNTRITWLASDFIPEGVDVADVYGFAINFDMTNVDPDAGFGGSIIFSVESNNWNGVDWSNESDNYSDGVLTRLEDAPFFSAADLEGEWQNIVIDAYWGSGEAVIKSVDALDENGNVISTDNTDDSTDDTDDSTDVTDDSAVGDVDAPTTDKNSPDTGVEGVAIVAGLAVIAAGAVVVAKKRK